MGNAAKGEKRCIVDSGGCQPVEPLFPVQGGRHRLDHAHQRAPAYQVMNSAGMLAAVTLYCYCADRTDYFEKGQKVAHQDVFLLILAASFVPCLLSMTCPTTTTTSGNIPEKGRLSSSKSSLPLSMSREQTDEWKGWMQLVVLLYHYFGMSRVLWVYQIVRLLVASYLFMTGFGHTAYFLKTNDYSLRRNATVLLRLNLLSIILAYVMNTAYDFYYFPALCSFWYVVVYLTMCTSPYSSRKGVLVTMAASLASVKLLIERPGVLEAIVESLRTIFRMHLNVHELRFRISLDLYVVYAGMLFAVFTYRGWEDSGITDSATHPPRLKLFKIIAIAVSVILLGGYFTLLRQFPDKYAYNVWHPMISPFPVLAYVVLRNATPLLRSYHSRLFAWLGRCSLETFILQYHIWLAADTKGVLRLGLFGDGNGGGILYKEWSYWLEFILITILFLWLSWLVSIATGELTKWIVGHKEVEGRKVTWRIWWPPGLYVRVLVAGALLLAANWTWV